jgi:hypothetical protein
MEYALTGSLQHLITNLDGHSVESDLRLGRQWRLGLCDERTILLMMLLVHATGNHSGVLRVQVNLFSYAIVFWDDYAVK